MQFFFSQNQLTHNAKSSKDLIDIIIDCLP